MVIDWLVDALKKKAQNAISATKSFIADNPTPVSYVAKKINPPVISPIPSPASKINVPRSSPVDMLSNAISKSTSFIKQNPSPMSYAVKPVQKTIQTFSEQHPTASRAITKYVEPVVNRAKTFLSEPYKPVTLPSMRVTSTDPIKNALMKVPEAGYNYLVKPIAEGAINAPSNYIGGITRTGLDLGGMARGEKVPIRKVAGDIGSVAKAIMDVSVTGASKRVAETAGAGAMRKGFLSTLKEGALEGAKFGAKYGAAGSVAENRDSTKSTPQYLLDTLESTIGGSAGGAALGAGASAAGYVAGKMFGSMYNALKERGMSDAQAKDGVRRYVRDGFGKFAKDKPTYYQDLTDRMPIERLKKIKVNILDDSGKRVSLPMDEYMRKYGQAGFVDFGAEIGGKKKIEKLTLNQEAKKFATPEEFVASDSKTPKFREWFDSEGIKQQRPSIQKAWELAKNDEAAQKKVLDYVYKKDWVPKLQSVHYSARGYESRGIIPKLPIGEAKIEGKTAGNAKEAIDTIREAIYSGDVNAAKQLHKDFSVDTKLPAFENIQSEVQTAMDKEMKGVGPSTEFGDYQTVAQKMRNLLRISGEKRSGTGELLREHIPSKVFGVSSDEVSSALGMTESEFMSTLTKDLKIVEQGKANSATIGRLNSQFRRLGNNKNKLKLNSDFYTVMTDWQNKTLAVSSSATPETIAKTVKTRVNALQQQATAEFDSWNQQYRKATVTPTEFRNDSIKKMASAIEKNTVSPGGRDVEGLKDISGWNGQMRDVYRNFKAVYGKRFDEVKNVILDPFDRSKGSMYDELSAWDKKLKENVVDTGIKKGSAESEAVQLFGEKQIDEGALVQKFGREKADKIIAADKFFRNAYDTTLNEINAVRKRIYPNNPTKLIPHRDDYYRHFHEMQDGVGGLINIFESPSGIASSLSGVSEYTKPKSKWASIAQKRLGLKTQIDAVGGFIDYIKQAEYAKHIDPHIEGFRGLANELAQNTAEGDNKGKVNNFIEFLQDFSNDLSGKTNPADRFVQKIIPGGRKTFRAINWLNSRVKSNTILGNASSSLAQFGNVPQGIASAGPKYSLKGLGRSLASIFTEDPEMNKSNFLKERYARPFEQFDQSLMDNTKKFAGWMTGALDEVGSKLIWESHFEKARAEGIANPVKYADDMTRSLVAGRGIGEVPLMQKSKIFQLVAPFQLEVQNLWYVMKDMVDAKQFGKLATLFVSSYVYNRAIEKIRGSGAILDPIQAVMEGYQAFSEEDNKAMGAMKFGGRVAGEVLSNIPGGQSVAAMYPENGVNINGMQLPTRKKLFGREDPTRFGGGLLAAKALQDPLSKIVPPFGGVQIKKTIEGIDTFKKGYNESKGKLMYPVEKSPANLARTTLFGRSSTPEANEYYAKERTALGEKQSEMVKKAPDMAKAYSYMIKRRELGSEEDKIYDAIKNKQTVNYTRATPKAAAEAIHRTIAAGKDKYEKLQKYKELKQYMTPEIQSNLNEIAKLEYEGFSREDRELTLVPEEIRARAVHERLMGLTDKKNRLKKYEFLVKYKVITPAVGRMLSQIAKEEKLSK